MARTDEMLYVWACNAALSLWRRGEGGGERRDEGEEWHRSSWVSLSPEEGSVSRGTASHTAATVAISSAASRAYRGPSGRHESVRTDKTRKRSNQDAINTGGKNGSLGSALRHRSRSTRLPWALIFFSNRVS